MGQWEIHVTPKEAERIKSILKDHLSVNVESQLMVGDGWEEGEGGGDVSITTTVQLLWDGQVMCEQTSEESSVEFMDMLEDEEEEDDE